MAVLPDQLGFLGRNNLNESLGAAHWLGARDVHDREFAIFLGLVCETDHGRDGLETVAGAMGIYSFHRSGNMGTAICRAVHGPVWTARFHVRGSSDVRSRMGRDRPGPYFDAVVHSLFLGRGWWGSCLLRFDDRGFEVVP